MKQEDIEFILKSKNKKNNHSEIQDEIRDEISEEEAIKIYNEIIDVLGKHHLSYKCAFNISVSLMYAFMTGAAELYNIE